MLTTLDLSAGHPAFAGHFPGFPVMPGAVLLDEALFEIARQESIDLTHWQVASVKFLALVKPGDALVLDHAAAGGGHIRFTIRSSAGTVVTGLLTDVAHGA